VSVRTRPFELSENGLGENGELRIENESEKCKVKNGK
jgi:hypothetical protein